MEKSAAYFAYFLQKDNPVRDDSLSLNLGECRIRLRSNSKSLLNRLSKYFQHILDKTGPANVEITAIEAPPPNLTLNFRDWPREPGKSGRKDACLDIPGGRLVQKVRTGMLFLQSENWKIACGPCLDNDNQVINFINSQYMNWLQHRNWLICHAAGISYFGRGMALAGFSGGGKSTLMLKLLDHEKVHYLTNDRLFIRKNQTGIVQSAGIPKLPRINPGTIINNPKLAELIPAERRQTLLNLPAEELWNLDEKHDVYIDRIYGRNRIVRQAPLHALVILNWERNSSRSVQIRRVDLQVRTELLKSIMKSPGPFYQSPDGSFLSGSEPFEQKNYLDTIANVPVYEAYGGVDFQRLSEYCMEILDRSPACTNKSGMP